MGLRSDPDGLQNQGGRSAGGEGWFRGALQRILRQPTPNDGGVNNHSATDGNQSPNNENLDAVNLTFEQLLEEKHFYEASLLLTSRENHLFGELTEEVSLQLHKDEIDKLAADRRDLQTLVLQTVQQTLQLSLQDINSEAAASPLTTLTSAVNAIYQQEEQDQLWKHIKCRCPSNWKKLHDSTLRALVASRMDAPSADPAGLGEQSSLQLDIHCMGRQLKEDLLLVVNTVRRCYPPEADICHFYALLYHQTFSARLKKIADFVLDDKDCTFLLRWVNDYYPGILEKPELASDINSAALGKLLPKELLEPLEEQYLSKQKDELATYMGRVLEEERKKWNKGHKPSGDDSCDLNPLAYDIIQFINGMVTAGNVVTGSLDKAQRITWPLTDLVQRFKAFQEDIIMQNRPNSKAYIKANLGSIEQFRDVIQRKEDLFPKKVQRTCLTVLTEMKQSAHMYLLSPVHKLLKPQYRKLGTSDWLKKNVFDKLLDSIEQELQELQCPAKSSHQELIGLFHQEVTQEYVKRLLRVEVKLKDKEQQQAACTIMMDNAESLHTLFTRMGSKEDWLKEILIKIAEVLKLQDIPAIQVQMVSLGSAYPDLREKHVSALLKLKTNISKGDRKTIKETLSDILKQTSAGTVSRQPFFSKIEVK
ncbi:tumor necrosis factor alpha-induced protein 2 isoform X2 [Melanotaenia boesemani]|nr:tumor necrosis factor alpha-induced protein 2 isoform X2 [Melanotaenia boesemani]XP_041828816.1 tumor necrosis factor alpha-induced protein 2 isoform X2 [Melanotaenia boesemani]